MNINRNDKDKLNVITKYVPDKDCFFSYITKQLEKLNIGSMESKKKVTLAKDILIAYDLMIRLLNLKKEKTVDIYDSLNQKKEYFVQNHILNYEDILELASYSSISSSKITNILNKITCNCKNRPISIEEVRNNVISYNSIQMKAAAAGCCFDLNTMILENEKTERNAIKLYKALHITRPSYIRCH